MKKINFKQPKYIFPAVVFIPIVGLIYFVSQMFEGRDDNNTLATDQINAELPEARDSEHRDKMSAMTSRFGVDDDAYSAIGSIGKEQESQDSIEHGYTEEELNRIDAEEAERMRQQKELQELQRSMAESRKHINSYANGGGYDRGVDSYGYDEDEDYYTEMQRIHERSAERTKRLNKLLGIEDPEEVAAREKRIQDSIVRAKEIEREKNRPNLVIKSKDSNADKFNTLASKGEAADAPLIKAMIDQTTKAREGTRIRFKLLDNITIKGVELAKGSYLYGTVTGFGQQRVKANITSILMGNKFIRVNLAVYDVDGMEGFYVPESAFRELMKDATASTIQQNVSFDTGTGSSGFNAEALALQALQNVYNSATSAVSNNVRKNKAKIKYNTIVYLINSEDAR